MADCGLQSLGRFKQLLNTPVGWASDDGDGLFCFLELISFVGDMPRAEGAIMREGEGREGEEEEDRGERQREDNR